MPPSPTGPEHEDGVITVPRDDISVIVGIMDIHHGRRVDEVAVGGVAQILEVSQQVGRHKGPGLRPVDILEGMEHTVVGTDENIGFVIVWVVFMLGGEVITLVVQNQGLGVEDVAQNPVPLFVRVPVPVVVVGVEPMDEIDEFGSLPRGVALAVQTQDGGSQMVGIAGGKGVGGVGKIAGGAQISIDVSRALPQQFFPGPPLSTSPPSAPELQ